MHINSTLEPQWNQFGSFSEAASVTGTLSRVLAYTYVQVPSGLAVRGSFPIHEPLLRALAPWLGGPFGLVCGLMTGLRCCASHGSIISIQGLAANGGSPWIVQASNLLFCDAVVNTQIASREVDQVKRLVVYFLRAIWIVSYLEKKD